METHEEDCDTPDRVGRRRIAVRTEERERGAEDHRGSRA
jgi:hypothetical protein